MTFPESQSPPHRYPILKSKCWENFVCLFWVSFLISYISNDSACVKTARVFQRFATWTRRHFVGTLTNLAARGDELPTARIFARLCLIFYREYCETLSETATRVETMQNMVYFGYLKVPTEELALFPTVSLLASERVPSVSSSSIKYY
jgi:hypothetical protein